MTAYHSPGHARDDVRKEKNKLGQSKTYIIL